MAWDLPGLERLDSIEHLPYNNVAKATVLLLWTRFCRLSISRRRYGQSIFEKIFEATARSAVCDPHVERRWPSGTTSRSNESVTEKFRQKWGFVPSNCRKDGAPLVLLPPSFPLSATRPPFRPPCAWNITTHRASYHAKKKKEKKNRQHPPRHFRRARRA